MALRRFPGSVTKQIVILKGGQRAACESHCSCIDSDGFKVVTYSYVECTGYEGTEILLHPCHPIGWEFKLWARSPVASGKRS